MKAAALSLFAKQGYNGTSTKEICDAAGANIAAVTYHFETKEKLLVAILSEQIKENAGEIDLILKDPENIESLKIRLSMFCEAFLDFRIKNPDFHRLLVHEAFHIPVAFETFKAAVEIMDSKLLSFLKVAKRNGCLQKEIDVETAAFLLVQMMTGPRLEAAANLNPDLDVSHPKKRALYVERMLGIFFHGVLNSKEVS